MMTILCTYFALCEKYAIRVKQRTLIMSVKRGGEQKTKDAICWITTYNNMYYVENEIG